MSNWFIGFVESSNDGTDLWRKKHIHIFLLLGSVTQQLAFVLLAFGVISYLLQSRKVPWYDVARTYGKLPSTQYSHDFSIIKVIYLLFVPMNKDSIRQVNQE